MDQGPSPCRVAHGLAWRWCSLVVDRDRRGRQPTRRTRLGGRGRAGPIRDNGRGNHGLALASLCGLLRPETIAQHDMADAGSGDRRHRLLDDPVPAIWRARIRAVLALLWPHPADDQAVGGAGECNVKKAPMLLEVALLLLDDGFLEWRAALLLLGTEQWRDDPVDRHVHGKRSPPKARRIRRRIGEDHDRRLQTLGPVHG